MNDLASEFCPRCGADHGNNYFDRSLCPAPCGSMHQRCAECGLAQDGCPFESGDPLAPTHERP